MISPHRGRKYFLSPRGVMAIEFSHHKEICAGGKNRGRKKLVLIYFEEERIRGV